MNNVPPFSQNRGDIKYIKFEILQIVSSYEDVKFFNGHLRKYGNFHDLQNHLFKLENYNIVERNGIPKETEKRNLEKCCLKPHNFYFHPQNIIAYKNSHLQR